MYCLCFPLRCVPNFLVDSGFFCQCFPSLVERLKLCRCTNGSADVVRLAPCPICVPSLPARYALGVGARCGGWFASQWRTTPPPRVRPHQPLALSSSALSHEPISQVLSREAPERSQHACAFSDVVGVANATDVPSITERHSLPLSSHTRIAVGRPYGFTSPCGERYGFTLFR